MTSTQVIDLQEARRRRAQIVSELRISEEELCRRASMYQADAAELAALDRLDELDFLLGQ